MAFTTFKPDFSETMPGVSASGIALLNDITASDIWADATIHYGFGSSGDLSIDPEFEQMFGEMFRNVLPDDVFAFSDLARQSFSMIDSVAGLDFAETVSLNEVDLVLFSAYKPNSTLEGFFQFPGHFDHEYNAEEYWSIGGFNSGMNALTALPESGGGQYGSWTVLHEIGHSLGLMHTHSEFNGKALKSVGRFMDNERYSVMSYNGASRGTEYGHAVSMMALDVAALQALYGVEDYAGAGSTYSLMDARGGELDLTEGSVSIGRAYYCVWDSGGEDEINYAGGGKSVMINLNDATLDTSSVGGDLKALLASLKVTAFFKQLSNQLQDEITDTWHHAGGFFSRVLANKGGDYKGTDGGFSIANGAEIENAVGGDKKDLLIGNEGDNTLSGFAGNDTLLGGSGIDTLDGGEGKDRLDGGRGDDFLTGGLSKDTFVFSTGYGTDRILDFDDTDRIDLSRLKDVSSFKDLSSNHMSEEGGDVFIIAGGDMLVIENATIADLTKGDFLF